jgi:hypothetical protein
MFIIVERMLKVFRLIIKKSVHIIYRARNLSNKWMKGHLRETLFFSMIRASNWDCLKIGDTRENSNGENENHPLEVGSGGTLFFSQTNLRFLPHSPSKKNNTCNPCRYDTTFI